jgi:hypothetical protein
MERPDTTEKSDLVNRVVSAMDESDREPTELSVPPVDLFERIEDAASVPVVTAPTVVEYSIDCNDVVVSTGGDWNAFAAENDAGELAGNAPQLSLWSQIEGTDARKVWQLVVSEVRRSDSAAKVPFRCDSPGLRRWYEIDVTPGDDGSIDFRSRLLFEEERPQVALVRRGSQRLSGTEPIQVCCWCARGYDGRRWISIDELVWSQNHLEDEPVPEVSQGICRECASSMSAEAGRVAQH